MKTWKLLWMWQGNLKATLQALRPSGKITLITTKYLVTVGEVSGQSIDNCMKCHKSRKMKMARLLELLICTHSLGFVMDSGTYSTFLASEMDTSRLTNHGNWSRDPQMRSMRILIVSSYFVASYSCRYNFLWFFKADNVSQFKHRPAIRNDSNTISPRK